MEEDVTQEDQSVPSKDRASTLQDSPLLVDTGSTIEVVIPTSAPFLRH